MIHPTDASHPFTLDIPPYFRDAAAPRSGSSADPAREEIRTKATASQHRPQSGFQITPDGECMHATRGGLISSLLIVVEGVLS